MYRSVSPALDCPSSAVMSLNGTPSAARTAGFQTRLRKFATFSAAPAAVVNRSPHGAGARTSRCASTAPIGPSPPPTHVTDGDGRPRSGARSAQCSASGSLAYTNRGAQNVPIWVRGDLAEGRGQVGLASATVEEPALWGLTWQYQGARYRLLRSAAWLLVLRGCRPSPRCLVPRRNRVGRAWPGQPLPADGTAGPRSPPT